MIQQHHEIMAAALVCLENPDLHTDGDQFIQLSITLRGQTLPAWLSNPANDAF
jgi:hypothetical protein